MKWRARRWPPPRKRELVDTKSTVKEQMIWHWRHKINIINATKLKMVRFPGWRTKWSRRGSKLRRVSKATTIKWRTGVSRSIMHDIKASKARPMMQYQRAFWANEVASQKTTQNYQLIFNHQPPINSTTTCNEQPAQLMTQLQASSHPSHKHTTRALSSIQCEASLFHQTTCSLISNHTFVLQETILTEKELQNVDWSTQPVSKISCACRT